MSEGANLREISALGELRSGLIRFGSETQSALNAAALEIRRTLDWLQERAQHWQNQVRQRQAEVEQAAAALRRCEASGYYDRDSGRYYPPNCSAEQHALLKARLHLVEAETALKEVKDWARLVQQSYDDYHIQAQRLEGHLNQEVQVAEALLQRKEDILNNYVAQAPPEATHSMKGGSSPEVERSSERERGPERG
ncbi:MAG: hypothetical protein AB1894_23995 [Chloroflexota bacterium]